MFVKVSRHIGEAVGDGLDVEVKEMKVLLVTPRFLAPPSGWGSALH